MVRILALISMPTILQPWRLISSFAIRPTPQPKSSISVSAVMTIWLSISVQTSGVSVAPRWSVLEPSGVRMIRRASSRLPRSKTAGLYVSFATIKAPSDARLWRMADCCVDLLGRLSSPPVLLWASKIVAAIGVKVGEGLRKNVHTRLCSIVDLAGCRDPSIALRSAWLGGNFVRRGAYHMRAALVLVISLLLPKSINRSES